MSILRVPPDKQDNSYIGFTNTTLSRRLSYHLSENSAIKHLIIKHNNSTKQLTSSGVRKILTDDTIIIFKNNNKKRLEATMHKKKSKHE